MSEIIESQKNNNIVTYLIMGKIGVLTQPLHDNYGGLLQAYALKETLHKNGHEVFVVNRRSPQHSRFKLILSKFKKKLLGEKINPKNYLSDKERQIMSQHTLAFREKYIPHVTPSITDTDGLKKLNSSYGFDAYIVGSDQCWRPRYSPNITNYFLDFIKDQSGIKRISYAASFGVAHWEFNQQETAFCSELAALFDAISVREDSGIPLVKEHLNQDAIHVVDPTMLLQKEDYIKMVDDDKSVTPSPGDLNIYILDRTTEKQQAVENVAMKLGLKPFEILPKKRLGVDKLDRIHDFVFPSPTQWIQGFRDARFVITDSFHGTVFSILFNIPFLVFTNVNRGASRFESLLRKFQLEDRLISDIRNFKFQDYENRTIDWNSVNQILEQEKRKSLNFLINNIS